MLAKTANSSSRGIQRRLLLAHAPDSAEAEEDWSSVAEGESVKV